MNVLEAELGEDAGALAPHFEGRSVPLGEQLVTLGQPAGTLFFVARGTFSVEARHGAEPVDLGTLSAPCWVGEVGFVDGGLATATLTATEPCLVYGLRRESVVPLRRQQPAAMGALLARLNATMAQRMDITSGGVVEVGPDGSRTLQARPKEARTVLRRIRRLLGVA